MRGPLTEPRPDTGFMQVQIYEWEPFLCLGEDVEDVVVASVCDSLEPNQCCALIYSTAPGSPPLGAMLSHDNLTWTARNLAEQLGGITPSDRFCSYLPLSHIGTFEAFERTDNGTLRG